MTDKMASFFFISSSKFISPQQICLNQSPLLCHGGKSRLCHSNFFRNLSHSHSMSHAVFEIVGISCSFPRCGRLFSAKLNTNAEESKGKQTSKRKRKRLDLRLKPRLKLASIGLKRVFSRDFIDDMLIKLSKNSKKLTLSTMISFAMGLIFLFLKYTGVPSSKVVPYSDLISNLQSGSVSIVLFEEGSHRIFYNTVSYIHDNTKITVHAESKLVPKWQYATRKIHHDDNFLLGLMREKGITYSFEPQSVFMFTRSILLTIISLWIPLMPLIWLLYRQLSGSNSPAKKRRPTNLKVNFSDVEGVDTAKEELIELPMRRRDCCDVLPSSSETKMEINIRKCKDGELISMNA